MDLSVAKSALGGARFGDLRQVAETGSTNSDLMDAARRGEGEQVLVADHQTAGRGRLDRVWEAQPGASLLMSILVRPPFRSGVHAVPTALGVAMVDAITSTTDIAVGLKWPNDLVVRSASGDRKLGGILAESLAGPPAPAAASPDGSSGLDAVVVGVGVNLERPSVPDGLEGIATALDVEGGDVDRFELVVEVLGRFATALDDPALPTRYRAACVTIGRRVRVEQSSGDLIGDATDVKDTGELVVTDDHGVSHGVSVGDVVHLRDAR